jgi:hypothetical protein
MPETRGRPPLKKCKQGHPLKKPNLIFRDRGGKQVRECRECANKRMRDRRAEQRKKKAVKGRPKRKAAKKKAS